VRDRDGPTGDPTEADAIRKKARVWLLVFVIGVVLSGATAFALSPEVGFLRRVLVHWRGAPSGLVDWIERVDHGLRETYARYPFMAYGTDWLGFAHLVIAVLFWGPLRDPVRNLWVIEFGMIACAMVIPLALICGALRGIPFFWQLVDCSFGVFGVIPLWLARGFSVRIAEMASQASCRTNTVPRRRSDPTA